MCHNFKTKRLRTSSADVCRWLYARQIPSSNLYFGEKSADEVRSRFVLKLWHTCKFFCDYAHLDGFDPYRDIVPVAERTDMDRWILSDLQLLVAESRRSFEAFALRDFALEVEKYIDDKLSNWYVRRSRRRFWKNDDRRDQIGRASCRERVCSTV